MIKKAILCQNCGSEDTCRVLYGMVDYDEAMERREAAGKVHLGGCCVEFDDAGHQLNRHCNACDQNFFGLDGSA